MNENEDGITLAEIAKDMNSLYKKYGLDFNSWRRMKDNFGEYMVSSGQDRLTINGVVFVLKPRNVYLHKGTEIISKTNHLTIIPE